jgi:uncharacterized lipoprotein
MSVRKIAFLLVLLTSAGAVLSACGRRNEPISPYEAAQQRRSEAEKAGEPVPPQPVKPPVDRPFILDGLID